MLLANHAIYPNWSENALNLALVGAAWVVADSLARPAFLVRATSLRV
jgi:hypothetical protein